MNDYMGEKFLDKCFRTLYMSDEVQHTKDKKDNRLEAIKKYLERLERVHNKANTNSKKNMLKHLYYEKYIIKKEVLIQKLTEKNILINDQAMQLIQTIIEEQKKSLDKWIDYLSDDTAGYPLWFKYWIFQSMLKMGVYDEGIGGYLKRTEDTEAIFVEANPEIIAQCYDVMLKELKIDKTEGISDAELKQITATRSFSKIYTILEKRYKNEVIEKSDSTDGIWVMYQEGKEEDAKKLCASLQNKNTHWCTAGENMAINQVCGGGPYLGGDFYVYYTKDKKGEYTIPRIAIRMEHHDKIGEIRGVLEGQCLEEEMESILEAKLKEMTNVSEESIQKALNTLNNLRSLTDLYIKSKQHLPISEEEIKKLFKEHYGFGYQNDPRVYKVIESNYMIGKKIMLEEIENRNLYGTTYDIIEARIFQDDKDVILKLLQNHNWLIGYASPTLQEDKDVALVVVTQNGNLLKKFPKFQNDEDVVLAAVGNCGLALEYVSPTLQDVKNIVLIAIKEDSRAIKYASPTLQKDKDVILAIITQSGMSLKEFPEFQDDEDVALAAVGNCGLALEYVSPILQKNKNVVLAAVENFGYALQYASLNLQDDKDVVLAAVGNCGSAIQYASPTLQGDKDIALTAVEQEGYALKFVSPILQDDKDVVLAAVKQHSRSLKYASPRLQDDKDVVLAAVKQNGRALKYASPRLQKDEEILSLKKEEVVHYINF